MASDNYKIGIDLGGTKIEIILLDKSGTELFRKRIKTPKNSYSLTLELISKLVFEAENLINSDASVGIGIPGKLSQKNELIEYANSTYLIGKPLILDLENLLNRKINVQNDANCFTLSEYTDGAGKNVDSLFGVILGSGVGGGIVINDRLHEGLNSNSGEWGHNQMPWSSELELKSNPCYCGRLGCIEAFLSGKGFQKTFFNITNKNISPEKIVELVDQEDEFAIQAMELYELRLAKSLSIVINLLDPDMIVLGGGLSNINRIYDKVPMLLDEYVLSDSISTQIIKAVHGDSSGVRGAAWL